MGGVRQPGGARRAALRSAGGWGLSERAGVSSLVDPGAQRAAQGYKVPVTRAGVSLSAGIESKEHATAGGNGECGALHALTCDSRWRKSLTSG